MANINEKGKHINEAFLYIQQVLNECQRLIFKVDSEMASEWNALYGNRITKDVSADLRRPSYWLIYAIFRYYGSKTDDSTIKGISITLWDDYEVKEPIIIAGKIIYNDINAKDHWDLSAIWHEWESEHESNEYKTNGEINYFKSKECEHIEEAFVFSWPLVSISNDETLMEKIIVPLKEL